MAPLFLDPNHTATPAASFAGLERAIVGADRGRASEQWDDLPLPPLLRSPRLAKASYRSSPVDRREIVAPQAHLHWTGVPFTMRGFPDFCQLPPDTAFSSGELTGLGKTDAKLANAAVGLDKTPIRLDLAPRGGLPRTRGLIPTLLHVAVGHTGGVAMMKHGAC